MERHEDIWYGVLIFLGDGSIASVACTCRTLYFIARKELKVRAKKYLESNSVWEHGFYPKRGYYGTEANGDGNGDGKRSGSGIKAGGDGDVDGDRKNSGSRERTWWVRCLCGHHEKVISRTGVFMCNLWHKKSAQSAGP